MAKIYCTKCGLRGTSKCPHCRSIFADHIDRSTDENVLRGQYLEILEMYIGVGLASAHNGNYEQAKKEREKLANDADHTEKFIITFWTYANNDDKAIADVLSFLKNAFKYLTPEDLKVAACVHDWQLLPGEKSSIGCGHEGDPNAVVPDDPFSVVERTQSAQS